MPRLFDGAGAAVFVRSGCLKVGAGYGIIWGMKMFSRLRRFGMFGRFGCAADLVWEGVKSGWLGANVRCFRG